MGNQAGLSSGQQTEFLHASLVLFFVFLLLQSIADIASCFGRSQSEATQAATLLGVDSRLVAQRFPYCDGIARYLFSSPSEDIPEMIHRIVSNIDSSFIRKIVRLNKKPSDIHQGVGTILVFDSHDPFTSREPYQLSSRYVASEVAANFEKERGYQMQSFLSGDTETLFTLSNIGTELFEGYAARKVFFGGTFRVCRCCAFFFLAVLHFRVLPFRLLPFRLRCRILNFNLFIMTCPCLSSLIFPR